MRPITVGRIFFVGSTAADLPLAARQYPTVCTRCPVALIDIRGADAGVKHRIVETSVGTARLPNGTHCIAVQRERTSGLG